MNIFFKYKITLAKILKNWNAFMGKKFPVLPAYPAVLSLSNMNKESKT